MAHWWGRPVPLTVVVLSGLCRWAHASPDYAEMLDGFRLAARWSESHDSLGRSYHAAGFKNLVLCHQASRPSGRTLAYVHVYKAGGTTFKQYMHTYCPAVSCVPRPCTRDDRAQFKPGVDVLAETKHDFVFTVVRDPVARFVSAIHEINLRRPQTWGEVEAFARAHGFHGDDNNSSQLPQSSWPHVILTKMAFDGGFFNQHFLPQHLFLRKRDRDVGERLQVDYIGKLENLPPAAQLFKTMLLHDAALLRVLDHETLEKPLTQARSSSKHTGSSPPIVLTGSELEALCCLYYEDFVEFEYPLPDACRRAARMVPGSKAADTRRFGEHANHTRRVNYVRACLPRHRL